MPRMKIQEGARRSKNVVDRRGETIFDENSLKAAQGNKKNARMNIDKSSDEKLSNTTRLMLSRYGTRALVDSTMKQNKAEAAIERKTNLNRFSETTQKLTQSVLQSIAGKSLPFSMSEEVKRKELARQKIRLMFLNKLLDPNAQKEEAQARHSVELEKAKSKNVTPKPTAGTKPE